MISKLFAAFGLLLGIVCITMLGMLVIEALKAIAFFATLATTPRF